MADASAGRFRRRSESLRVSTASRVLPLVAGYGLNLVATPITAAGLGLAQFGIWALTGAIAQYGGLLDLGVSRSVTRFTALHLARSEEESAERVLATAVTLVTALGILLVLLAVVLAAPFSALIGFADTREMRIILIASVVILVLGQFITILNGAAWGREFQLLPNIVSSVCNVTSTTGSTVVAAVTHDLVAYAVSIAVLNTLTTVVLATAVHVRIARLRPRKPSWTMLRSLMSFGLKGQSALLAELTIFQLSKVFLGVVAGPAAAGAYELGSRLALGFRAVGALFMGALLAPLTRAFSANGVEHVAAETERYTRRVVALAIYPPLVGLALAPSFLSLWLGDYRELTLVVMTGLCLAFTANLFTSIQSVAAEAIGRPGLNARASIFTAILSVVLGVPGLLLTGPIGLVAATTFAVIVGSVYAIQLIQPALYSSPRVFFRVAAGPLLFGLTACVVARVATLWLPEDTRWQSLIAVVVGGVVFTALYGGLTIWRGYIPVNLRFIPKRPASS